MNLTSDMSIITTIPTASLEKLVDKSKLCILHKVAENELKHETVTDIDIGFGTLYIKHCDNELKYKFIPSKSFEEELKKTVLTKESPLIEEVETALKDRILNTYKDLF